MAELLERTQSSYFPAFKKIFKDVVAGKFLTKKVWEMYSLVYRWYVIILLIIYILYKSNDTNNLLDFSLPLKKP